MFYLENFQFRDKNLVNHHGSFIYAGQMWGHLREERTRLMNTINENI